MELLAKFPENFPFFTVICGLLSAVVCIFLKGKAARNCTVGCQILVSVLNGGALLYMTFSGKSYVVYRLGPEKASFAAINQLRFSQIECLVALLFSLVILLSVIGGYRYVRQDIDKGKIHLYYILINLLGSALAALTYTNDLFTGYVFLEILTLTSCGILMIRELGRTTVAAVRYMIMNLLGSGLFLLGVILLYAGTGNLLMEEIRAQILLMGDNIPLPIYTATALICAGLAIKSGMFPFHFWMPDTYGCATPTSACVLSGVVSKGYIFLLVKVLVRVIGVECPSVQKVGYLLFAMGICGMLFGSLSAIRQGGLNKMLAFSSAAQIGYIYTGIGIGCIYGHTAAAVFGFSAAVFHIFTHALTKPLLFLTSARLIEVSGNSSVFKRLRGSASKAPSAALGFTVGALSMVGVPVFAGFVSKILFSVAAIRSGNIVFLLVMLLALAISTLLNTLYFLKTVITVYVSDKGEEDNRIPAGSLRTEKSLLFSSVAFTALNILLGCGAGAVLPMVVTAFEQGIFG